MQDSITIGHPEGVFEVDPKTGAVIRFKHSKDKSLKLTTYGILVEFETSVFPVAFDLKAPAKTSAYIDVPFWDEQGRYYRLNTGVEADLHVEIYRDGQLLERHEDQCGDSVVFKRLHSLQGQSISHALKYEGWGVKFIDKATGRELAVGGYLNQYGRWGKKQEEVTNG